MSDVRFEWDEAKNLDNQRKHGVSFQQAQHAFLDRGRVIAENVEHSASEQRYHCFGLDRAGAGVLTVHFTYRAGRIRIIGAGYWRKGQKIYEQAHSVQR